MSLQESLEKIKPFYMLFLILILGSILAAGWQLAVLEGQHAPIKITNGAVQTATVANAVSDAVVGVVTSKKYYFPWCGTLKRVKPQNQISFSSTVVARSAGYLPGGNCKGLN